MTECLKSNLKIADNGDYRFCPYCGDEISITDQLQMLSTESMHLFSERLDLTFKRWVYIAMMVASIVMASINFQKFIHSPALIVVTIGINAFLLASFFSRISELKTIKSAIAENAEKTAKIKESVES